MHGNDLYAKYVSNNPDYVAYITKNGMHFTNKLAEEESAKMVNNGAPHSWTVRQVTSTITTSNPSKKFKHKMTDGDLTYGANMFYADLFPEAITVESGCIEAVKLIGNDKDGYEGQLFCRWLTDVMMQGVDIDWAKHKQ